MPAEFSSNDDAVLRITSDARQAAEALLNIEAAYRKTAEKIDELTKQSAELQKKLDAEVDVKRKIYYAQNILRIQKTIEMLKHQAVQAGIVADILTKDRDEQIKHATRFERLQKNIATQRARQIAEASREDAIRNTEESRMREQQIADQRRYGKELEADYQKRKQMFLATQNSEKKHNADMRRAEQERRREADIAHRNAVRQLEERQKTERRFLTGAGFGILQSGLPGTQTLGTVAVSAGFGGPAAAAGALIGAGVAGTLRGIVDISQKVFNLWSDITQKAFDANTKWEQSRIALAALLATNLKFSDSIGENFQIASTLSEDLQRKIVQSAIEFSGTSEELTLAFNKFVSTGGLALFQQDDLNTALDKGLKTTRLLAQAALLYTSGQNRNLQVQQEINAVNTQQVRTQDTISRMIFGNSKAEQEANFKLLEQYKERNEAEKFFEERLQGVVAAQEALGKSQAGINEAMQDMTTLILRSGTAGFFERVKQLQIEIVQFMQDNQDILSDLVSDFGRVNLQLLESLNNLVKIVTFSGNWEEAINKISTMFNVLEAVIISIEGRIERVFKGLGDIVKGRTVQGTGNILMGLGFDPAGIGSDIAKNLMDVQEEKAIDQQIQKTIEAGIEAKKLIGTIGELSGDIPKTVGMLSHINTKISEGIKLNQIKGQQMLDFLRRQQQADEEETASQEKRLAALKLENILRQIKLELARKEMEIGLEIARLDFRKGTGTERDLDVLRQEIELQRELASAKIDALTRERIIVGKELADARVTAKPGTKDFYDQEIKRLELQNKLNDAVRAEEDAHADLARFEIKSLVEIDIMKKRILDEEFRRRLDKIRAEIAAEKEAWEALQKIKAESAEFTGEKFRNLPDSIVNFLNANTSRNFIGDDNFSSFPAAEVVRKPLPMEAINILVGTNLKEESEKIEAAISKVEARMGRLRAAIEKTNSASEKMALTKEITEAEKEEMRLNEQLITTLMLLRNLAVGTERYDELTVAIENATKRQIELQVASVSWAESLENSLKAVGEILGTFDSNLGKVGSNIGGLITSITKISELKDLKTGKAYGSIGAGLSGMFGSAQGFLTQGLPMIGTAVSFVGGIVNGIRDMFRQAAREAAEKISDEVNKITRAVEKSGRISEALIELEKQRTRAIATLSDKKKGGKEELDKLLPEIDEQIDNLKKKLNDINKTFETDILKLKVDEPIGKIVDDFQEMTRRIKEFVDANGHSAEAFAKAWEFASLSIAKMRKDIGDQMKEELKNFTEGAEDDWGNLISLEIAAVNEKQEVEKSYYEGKEAREKELIQLRKEAARQEKEDLEAIAALQKELLELNDKEKEDIEAVINEGIAEREKTTQQDKAQRIADIQDEASERRAEIEEELVRIREVAEERRIAMEEQIAALVAQDAEEEINYLKAISRIDKRLEREIALHNEKMAEYAMQLETIAQLEAAETQWLTNAQTHTQGFTSALSQLRLEKQAYLMMLDQADSKFAQNAFMDIIRDIDRRIAEQTNAQSLDPVLPIAANGTGGITTTNINIEINASNMTAGTTPEDIQIAVQNALDKTFNGTVPAHL